MAKQPEEPSTKEPYDPDCVFCRIVKGSIPSMKVYEDADVLAFLDIYPIAKGHTLVIPKAHYPDLPSTPKPVWAKAMGVVQDLTPKVRDAMGADAANVGVNVGRVAGQAVFHVHAHIIPRWEGDGLRHWPNGQYGKDEIVEVQEKIAKATGYQS